MTIATRPLRVGDCIEIVQYDESLEPANRLTLRRVKLARVSKDGDSYHVQGTNLKGAHPRSYTIPVEPIAGELPLVGEYTAWAPSPEGEGEE